MAIQVQGKTDTGCVRSQNEDSIDWWFFGGSNTLCCALADGMGGYEGGAMASQLAISAIRSGMTSQSLCSEPEWEAIQKKLNAAGHQANAAIQSMRNAEPRLNKMGTTLVVALVHQQNMCVMHAGDSRCYLFRDGTLSQLTRDDSVVQQMIDNGSISEEERENTPYRNVLVKAVGVEEVVEYSSAQTLLLEGDQVMLCSDGLFNTLSHEDIAVHLASQASTAEKVDSMISMSLEMGAPDNVSTILFSVND
jgi:PPM family protein phosphatase